MKPRETALRLKRFEAEEKARKVDDIERMIREFEAVSNDLDRQIQAEEDRTGIRDAAHFAYSTFAKSASARRDKLKASADELKTKLETALAEREAATEQLARYLSGDVGDVDRVGRRRAERADAAVLR